ncbi:hypothetical protein ASF40_09155 [Microbacterium sp. Leaf288]|uniref:alpha/beta fold hydrolase n=1 Tax=Microbacterium sp. Leaf288 TaxID=1736323 RepID=UPI0006FC2CE3|nr:alpha/beta hydrolase [Microbacterium sp. Leaf288]KQP69995.1 hypothetical protein ASF40_09155 [Microbacterium sp. Leaf288]
MPELGPIVLVPGAWHAGWTWRAVASRLRQHGYAVYTPTFPGLGFNDDPRGVTLSDGISYLTDYLEDGGISDATVVAHSWGGFAAAGAVPRAGSRMRRLVYWSAFVPQLGESFLDLLEPSSRRHFEKQAESSADRSVSLSLGAWKAGFMQDASDDSQRMVHNLLSPQPIGTLSEPSAVDAAALDIPSSYIFSPNDLAMPPGEYGWRRFRDRLPGAARISFDGSHESMFTCPDALTATLLSAIHPDTASKA